MDFFPQGLRSEPDLERSSERGTQERDQRAVDLLFLVGCFTALLSLSFSQRETWKEGVLGWAGRSDEDVRMSSC